MFGKVSINRSFASWLVGFHRALLSLYPGASFLALLRRAPLHWIQRCSSQRAALTLVLGGTEALKISHYVTHSLSPVRAVKFEPVQQTFTHLHFDGIMETHQPEGGAAPILLPPSLSQPETPGFTFLQSKSIRLCWLSSRNQHLQDETTKGADLSLR